MITPKTQIFAATLVLITGLSVSAWAISENESKIQGSISAKNLAPAEYPRKATITPAEASAIAIHQVPGSVLSLGLENEDGFLVYAVNVAGQTTGFHEIIIDAGNGHVLSSASKKDLKNDDDEERDDD